MIGGLGLLGLRVLGLGLLGLGVLGLGVLGLGVLGLGVLGLGLLGLGLLGLGLLGLGGYSNSDPIAIYSHNTVTHVSPLACLVTHLCFVTVCGSCHDLRAISLHNRDKP